MPVSFPVQAAFSVGWIAITLSPMGLGDDSNVQFGALPPNHGLIDENAACDPKPLHERPTLPRRTSLDSDIELDDELDEIDLGTLPLTVRERITLRGLHSSGGIGEVWRAYDEVLDREIALKRLKDDQADHVGNRARFFREARITGQLDHPGIVPVYDFSATDDGRRCFYTMRFLRGRTLSAVITEFHENLDDGDDLVSGPFLQLLNNFISVCNTMAFAHSRGIVHRDLKGENVIVGNFGEVVVLDWGLAKRIRTDDQPSSAGGSDPAALGTALTSVPVLATMQGQRLGTPAFMAPEQAQGLVDRIDERTDVYGLSAILYDILTGRPPFLGDDVAAILDAVVETPPTPPTELIPSVPPQLERICMSGLAKARDARWQSVSELAAAVQAWLTTLAERKRTEQERERFFNLSLDLLAIVDQHGHITQSNAAWSSLLGWVEDARANAPLRQFVSPEHRELFDAELAKIWAGEPQAGFEIRMRHSEGGHRWIDLRARSIPNETGIYLVGRDVTERRQSEQQFIGLLESAPDATCVIDESGTIVLINHQLERMFGYPREELVGQAIEILVPEPLRKRHVDHVRRFTQAPSPRPMGAGLELTGQKQDGTIFPIEVSLSPVKTETRMLVSCALRAR
ncbi:Serine/threonine-protein kinase PknD [Enhygromyxa salina]|uniref:Serine/threonine-protein kinase PknD n=1 Tax=Enhygromyxa salina TaxID=215803 RepID=A0A2S9XIB7_9BACT|nr:Serine/threonine-protein kinase PknD [Enhygromyxa salina]